MERTSRMEIPAGAQMVVTVEVLERMFMIMYDRGLFVPGALPRIREIIEESAVFMSSTPPPVVSQKTPSVSSGKPPGGPSKGLPPTSKEGEASSVMPECSLPTFSVGDCPEVNVSANSSVSSSDTETITSQLSGSFGDGFTAVKRKRKSFGQKAKKAALVISDEENLSSAMEIAESMVAQSSDCPAAMPVNDSAPVEPVPTAGTTNSSAASKADKISPPPIFVKDKQKWSMAISALKTSGVDIKSAQNKTDAIIVRVQDGNSFRIATKILHDKGIGFYSYSFEAEKEIRVVIRGVPEHVPVDDLKAELAESGILPTVIHRMVRRRDNKPLPLVFVVAPIEQATKIFNVSTISYCKVRVEKAQKRQGAPQCHRCQAFYHVAKNCHMQPKCVRCAGDHLTAQCTVAKDAPVMCANCKLSHTANYRGCKLFPKLPVKRPTPRATLPPHRSAHTTVSSGRSFAQAAANNSEPTRPRAGPSGVSATPRPSGEPTLEARSHVSGGSAANASTEEATTTPTNTLAGIFAALSTLNMATVERQIAGTLADIRAAKSDEERKLCLINAVFCALK